MTVTFSAMSLLYRGAVQDNTVALLVIREGDVETHNGFADQRDVAVSDTDADLSVSDFAHGFA